MESGRLLHVAQARFGPQVDHMKMLYALGATTVRQAAQALSGTSSSQTQRLAMFFVARATTALHSTLSLFLLGLEDDATAAMRIISELYIDLCWIRSDQSDERADRYFNHVLSQTMERRAIFLRSFRDLEIGNRKELLESGVSRDGRPMQEINEALRAEYRAAKKKFDFKSRWTEKSVAERASGVGLSDYYDLVYGFASEASHSSMSNLSVSGQTITFGPQPPSGHIPMMLASHSFQLLVAEACECLGLSGDPILEAKKQFVGVFSSQPNAD